MKVKIQHTSMEFSDTVEEHRHDAQAVWSLDAHVVTGTEAGNNELHMMIPHYGREAGYRVLMTNAGEWLGVHSRFGKLLDFGFIKVIDAVSKPAELGGHTARGILWAKVKPTRSSGGFLTFGVSHFLTQRSIDMNHESNKPLQRAVGVWAEKHGQGKDIVFFNADTNINDKTHDVFDGLAPMKTCWDELNNWPSTGHGTIDIAASYNADRRVKCVGARALDDSVLQLYTDHFTIEAAYNVRS